MNDIILELQELFDGVNIFNYGVTIDEANLLLKKLEDILDKDVMDSIYKIAAAKQKEPFYNEILHVFMPNSDSDTATKVNSFQERLKDILVVLEKYDNVTF